MKRPYFARKRLEFATIYLFQHANKLNLPPNSVKFVKEMRMILVFSPSMIVRQRYTAWLQSTHVSIRRIKSVANFSPQNCAPFTKGLVVTLNSGMAHVHLFGLKVKRRNVAKPAVLFWQFIDEILLKTFICWTRKFESRFPGWTKLRNLRCSLVGERNQRVTWDAFDDEKIAQCSRRNK